MLRKLSKNAKITLSILFCFIGIVLISWNYFDGIKSNVFNHENIRYIESLVTVPEEIIEEPSEEEKAEEVKEEDEVLGVDDYIGYLEVPDVGIKRGFVSLESKYNTVGYNVTQIVGSTMPNVKNGNLILAAHRGNSSVSFFENLYKLEDGAKAYITYKGKTYEYTLKYRYTEPKDGSLTIRRNGDATTLTLITCTRNDKKTQTIFIFELSNVN